MLTAGLISLFALVILIVIIGWTYLLYVGLQLARVPNQTRLKLLTVTGLNVVLSICVNLIDSVFLANGLGNPKLDILLGIAIMIAIPTTLISWIYGIGIRQAIHAWLPTVLSPVLAVVFMLFIFRPYVLETMETPANSMAPTVLGPHLVSNCPLCGKKAFSNEPSKYYQNFMICENYHTSELQLEEKTLHPQDKFVVTKFLKAQRWDLIAFHHPEEPGVIYMKRLVGLPGESITINDGSVYIDQKKAELPNALKEIEYFSSVPVFPDMKLSGTVERPANLSSDEYFVLGDFSAESIDSRNWEHGDGVHHAYAVPASHIVGVVSHIYWPPSRWKAFR
jgi:signal peptidase I, bacterial type